jgi:hypothetical protein
MGEGQGGKGRGERGKERSIIENDNPGEFS